MAPIIENNKEKLFEILQKHKIKEAYVFGSAANGNFTEESDIDFLVEFEEDLKPLTVGRLLWDLQFALEDFFNRKIDLLRLKPFKNPYFAKTVENSKKKIYG